MKLGQDVITNIFILQNDNNNNKFIQKGDILAGS